MPPRSTKRASGHVSSDDELDAFDFLASQQSTGSDDHELEMAFARQYAAIREKKRKENEQRFLKGAYKQLSKEVAAPAEDLKATVSSLEELYAQFLQRYAANEDVIHKLWSQIHREQQKILNQTRKKFSTNVEARRKIEAGHVAGLSKIKAGCREFRGIIDQIYPVEDSD